MKFKSLYFLW